LLEEAVEFVSSDLSFEKNVFGVVIGELFDLVRDRIGKNTFACTEFDINKLLGDETKKVSFFSDKLGLQVVICCVNKGLLLITLNVKDFLLLETFEIQRDDVADHFLVALDFFKGFRELS
jgi:hypothetical protein